jgi:mycoredoxin
MSSDNLYTLSPKTIIFYSKPWCPDCHRARDIFAEFNITYQEIDIRDDKQACTFVRQINHGNESVPTIIFPDGTYLVEPGKKTLAEKLLSIQ